MSPPYFFAFPIPDFDTHVAEGDDIQSTSLQSGALKEKTGQSRSHIGGADTHVAEGADIQSISLQSGALKEKTGQSRCRFVGADTHVAEGDDIQSTSLQSGALKEKTGQSRCRFVGADTHVAEGDDIQSTSLQSGALKEKTGQSRSFLLRRRSESPSKLRHMSLRSVYREETIICPLSRATESWLGFPGRGRRSRRHPCRLEPRDRASIRAPGERLPFASDRP